MQTNFTAEQLRDPDTASSNAVLRTCVHCGMCTATCPTFLLLGDELDSPRGRIYLIKDMLETGRPATEEVVRHVDRCLSCLSCMTTCPSGVNYMHLVDHARTYIEQTYRRPLPERLLRSLLGVLLPRPGLFRLALTGARAGPSAGRLIPGKSMLAQRLRAMLSLAPAKVPPASPIETAAGLSGRGTAEGAGRAADRLRAAGADAAHQRSDHPPADPAGRRGRGGQRRRMLRRAQPSHRASTTGRWRWRGPTSRRGRERDAIWTRSSSMPRAAARRSRITASCSARSRNRGAARRRRSPA